MSPSPFLRTAFVAGVLIATSGLATAEIIRCTDDKGAVTYVNSHCPIRLSHPLGASPVKPASVKSKLGAPARDYAEAEKARAEKLAAKPAPVRRLVIDMATMNTAQVSALSNDHASSLIRDQLLAERMDREAKSWVFWRL
jgi:hypothetical protein